MILNQLIGVIGLENEDPDHVWSDDAIAIAQAAANRAALTLENARLLEESQRRANKERAISDATNRIGAALSMENILQTATEELERILGNSEVILQLQSDNDPNFEK
jgi:GAF domain-containing protein